MGGVQCYWEDEAATATGSRPTFAEGQLKARKIIGLVYLTEELFRDANALEVFGTAAFSKEMAFSLEAAIIGGNGAYRPLGVLNSPALRPRPRTDLNLPTATVLGSFAIWRGGWAHRA